MAVGSNLTQITMMLENILWLQERGWTLLSDVDLLGFWTNILGPIVQEQDPGLFDELDEMMR